MGSLSSRFRLRTAKFTLIEDEEMELSYPLTQCTEWDFLYNVNRISGVIPAWSRGWLEAVLPDVPPSNYRIRYESFWTYWPSASRFDAISHKFRVAYNI